MKYAVCLWPDDQQMTTIIQVCRTLETAKKVANRSDRLFVVPFSDDEEYCRKGYKFQLDWRDVVYMIPPQNDRKCGHGRFGHGLHSREAAPSQKDMELFWKNMERKIQDVEEMDSGLTYKMR